MTPRLSGNGVGDDQRDDYLLSSSRVHLEELILEWLTPRIGKYLTSNPGNSAVASRDA